MKTLTAIMLFVCCIPAQKDKTATAVLQSMYSRYHNKWQRSLVFNQTTERYRNDSLVNISTWYEHIVYPDMLRIDFNSKTSGSGVIFRNDSAYSFRNNKLTRKSADGNELMFFLGGLYFEPFDKVLGHFAALHYDLSKFHEDTWKGAPVYVLGADNSDEKVNQLWIDKKNLVAVRFIKYDDNTKEEGWFENHVPVQGGGWSETSCTFYINDKKLQVELYHDIIGGDAVDMNMFDPEKIGK